jgi:hypothetical protein
MESPLQQPCGLLSSKKYDMIRGLSAIPGWRMFPFGARGQNLSRLSGQDARTIAGCTMVSDRAFGMMGKQAALIG